jgi:hypothetical protein
VNEDNLRTRLEQITSGPFSDANFWPDQIRILGLTFPHTIQVIDASVDRLSNCFAYALGVSSDPRYREIAAWLPDTQQKHCLADGQFVLHLINSGIVQADPNGELIVYFVHQFPQHAGLLVGSRVQSKWGTGPVFQHELLELPSSSGNDTRRFRRHDPVMVIDEFIRTFGKKV